MTSDRAPGFRSLLLALCAATVLLAWCGLHPARAQMGHVHHWTESSAPEGRIEITHMGGDPITVSDPAVRCEILEIRWLGDGVYDLDACDAQGHDGNTYATDFDCKALRWRDFRAGDPDVLGKFGVMQNGVFTVTETTDASTGRMCGLPTSTHYKVARTHVGGDLRLELEVDDSGTVYAPGPVAAFDDPKRWQSFGSLPVEGSGCSVIQTWRGVARNEISFCLAGTAASGNSSVVPLDGNVRFSVPVTSWGYRGTTLDFALSYNSQSIVDPLLRQNQVRHPAGLSDRNPSDHYNPKWTHTYAQWIEVLGDGTAVWNAGDGTQQGFTQYFEGQQGPLWSSRDSTHTLVSTGLSEFSPVRARRGALAGGRALCGVHAEG